MIFWRWILLQRTPWRIQKKLDQFCRGLQPLCLFFNEQKKRWRKTQNFVGGSRMDHQETGSLRPPRLFGISERCFFWMPFFGWLVLSDEQMEQFRRVHPSLLNDEQMSAQRAEVPWEHLSDLKIFPKSLSEVPGGEKVGIQGSQKKLKK